MSKPMKKANELPQFTGPFQELIPKYISYKRAQGYKIGSPIVYRLREMDLFFKDRGIMDIQITRKRAEHSETAFRHTWFCQVPCILWLS